MVTFYLVRHGEADYSEMLENGFYGFGCSLAPLSENGINKAEMTAVDERLKTAEVIVFLLIRGRCRPQLLFQEKPV